MHAGTITISNDENTFDTLADADGSLFSSERNMTLSCAIRLSMMTFQLHHNGTFSW
jgi:hypothetical protein